MFTVEDVNSVLLTDRVNDFHSINTSLRGGLDYVLLDFVKVRKTGTGFGFTVENSLWCGGFYLTDVSGEYIPLTSSDYSYSDGVLSVDTDETDVVLWLYCSSFFTTFSLQYLDCLLNSLMSVVNEVNVTTDDFTSLNGTAITDSDISVSGEVVTCRGNTFYKGLMETPTPIIFFIGSGLYPGAPKAPVTIIGIDPDLGSITIELDNRKETIQPTSHFVTSTEYTIEDVDFTNYRAGDTFKVKVTYNNITYTLTHQIFPLGVYSVDDLEKAIELQITDINCSITNFARDVHINHPTTLTGSITFMGGNLIVDDNNRVTFKYLSFNGTDGGVLLGENTNIIFTNCTFSSKPLGSWIMANEDVSNIDSSLIIEDCSFRVSAPPFIMYDGDLRISNCEFTRIYYSTINKLEPAFIHMTGGQLTVVDTSFSIEGANHSVVSVEGYNLASLLLSEDTVFNGVTATELSKGNPSLQQYGITSTINANYTNGDETVHLTDGFYVAVEDKKIKNIKED